MDAERIRELADVIEKQPHAPLHHDAGFNMANFEHPCGTPACICGWAAEIWGDGASSATSIDGMDALGIDADRADGLFYAHDAKQSLRDITPAHAAAVLRHLADTGEVDWTVGAPEVSP